MVIKSKISYEEALAYQNAVGQLSNAVHVLATAVRMGLKKSELRVLASIALNKMGKAEASVTPQQIADDTEQNLRTVYNAMSALRDKGIVHSRGRNGKVERFVFGRRALPNWDVLESAITDFANQKKAEALHQNGEVFPENGLHQNGEHFTKMVKSSGKQGAQEKPFKSGDTSPEWGTQDVALHQNGEVKSSESPINIDGLHQNGEVVANSTPSLTLSLSSNKKRKKEKIDTQNILTGADNEHFEKFWDAYPHYQQRSTKALTKIRFAELISGKLECYEKGNTRNSWRAEKVDAETLVECAKIFKRRIGNNADASKEVPAAERWLAWGRYERAIDMVEKERKAAMPVERDTMWGDDD